MSQKAHRSTKHRWFSLPVSISVGLVGASIVPLIVILGFISLQTRPKLIDQANKVMTNDAQTRVQLIDTYFNERVADARAVAQSITPLPTTPYFLLSPPDPTSQQYNFAAQSMALALQAGLLRDANYRNWAVFNASGKLLMSAPQTVQAEKHGQDYVPAAYLTRIQTGNVFVSPVYGSADGKEATIDIYSPIRALATPANTNPPVIGFLRATLKLDYIWNEIVQKDAGNNGSGSYAFILDENGIRIADTDPTRRFTSVDKLPDDLQQEISQEQRFGSAQSPKILLDASATNSIKQTVGSATFQTQPAGQHEMFQVVRQNTTSEFVHWHYFVLSPVTAVTAVADNEFLLIVLVAVVASLIVAVVGWFVGRGMARPILSAVGNLRENSTALSVLASAQHDAATEQIWVVDSSQVGLQSVQYYTEAATVALRQLRDVVKALAQHWRESDPEHIDRALGHALKAILYLENAVSYQDASNQKLATALTVATQVTEQLHNSAISATDAASQLEDVVQRLLAVAGR